MRAGAFQPDMVPVFGERVDQKPVGFNVTVAAAGKIAAQRVILELRRQVSTGNQQLKYGLELFQILAALAGQFDILFELSRPAERPHRPKSA